MDGRDADGMTDGTHLGIESPKSRHFAIWRFLLSFSFLSFLPLFLSFSFPIETRTDIATQLGASDDDTRQTDSKLKPGIRNPKNPKKSIFYSEISQFPVRKIDTLHAHRWRSDLGINVSCTMYLAACVCVSDRAEGQRDRRLVEFQLNATRELLAARVPVTFVFSQFELYS